MRRDALRAGRNGGGVLKDRGTPENPLLWGFDFTFFHLHCLSFSSVEGFREKKGQLESQVMGAFWLKKLAGAVPRLEQPGAENHS